MTNEEITARLRERLESRQNFLNGEGACSDSSEYNIGYDGAVYNEIDFLEDLLKELNNG